MSYVLYIMYTCIHLYYMINNRHILASKCHGITKCVSSVSYYLITFSFCIAHRRLDVCVIKY